MVGRGERREERGIGGGHCLVLVRPGPARQHRWPPCAAPYSVLLSFSLPMQSLCYHRPPRRCKAGRGGAGRLPRTRWRCTLLCSALL